ncbi:toxin [Bacillus sp. CGMCC 1.16607]|uniref:anthrax toxin lethal factor-related metalloendopeptidase n=1 Tax=Bacillus sp. CGMCC 1.16607 TaxID=3351842 RepID=UPI00363A55CA
MVKKWAIAFSILVLSFSFYKISQASVEGIMLSEFNEDTVLRKSLTKEPKKQLDSIVILPEAPFNQKEAANIISRLSLLPDTLLDQIVDKDIKVKLFEGKLTKNPTASHLSGLIPRGYQTKITWDDVPGIGGGSLVLVKIGSSEKGKGHGSVNLELHELAHSIDKFILHEVKYNRLFLDAWEEERADLFPGRSYFLLFPEEYFAECFAMYYLNDSTKKTLFEHAPKTYLFINKINEKRFPNPLINH